MSSRYSNRKHSHAILNNMTEYIRSPYQSAVPHYNRLCAKNIFLTQCELTTSEMQIELDVRFGKTSITIPKNWKVEASYSSVLSIYNSDEGLPFQADTHSKTLTLTGNVVLSIVEIVRV